MQLEGSIALVTGGGQGIGRGITECFLNEGAQVAVVQRRPLAANPEHTVYCASKAGIHGLTKALAIDLGADNIRCNAIAPGWITSELSELYLASQPDPAAAREALHELHPAGRLGEPADIGNLAVFLASNRAGFLTGGVITLDGGRTAKLPLPF